MKYVCVYVDFWFILCMDMKCINEFFIICDVCMWMFENIVSKFCNIKIN